MSTLAGVRPARARGLAAPRRPPPPGSSFFLFCELTVEEIDSVNSVITGTELKEPKPNFLGSYFWEEPIDPYFLRTEIV